MPKKISLAEWIERTGENVAAALLEVEIRTIRAWRRGEKIPGVKMTQRIIDRTPVTADGIYSGETIVKPVGRPSRKRKANETTT